MIKNIICFFHGHEWIDGVCCVPFCKCGDGSKICVRCGYWKKKKKKTYKSRKKFFLSKPEY